MKSFLTAVCLVASSLLSLGQLQATLVDFEDLAGDDTPVANGYAGIKWGGSFLVHNDYSLAHAGVNSVRTPDAGAHEYVISFTHPEQIFEGGWFSSQPTPSGGPLTVSFNLYSAGQLMGSSPTLTVSGISTFLESGYLGTIDAVGVYSNSNGYYFLDQLEYHSAPSPLFFTVPEPSTMTLIGIGAMGMLGGVLRWRLRSPDDESLRAI